MLRRITSRLGSCAVTTTSSKIATIVTFRPGLCSSQEKEIARQQQRFLSTAPTSQDTEVVNAENSVSDIYLTDSKSNFGEESRIHEDKPDDGNDGDAAEEDEITIDITKFEKFPSKHTKKKVIEGNTDEPISLFAKVRTIADSRRLRNMRKFDRLIPGVYYGTEDDGTPIKQLITLESKTVVHEMRKRGMKLENTLYNLDIEGVCSALVVARNTQINPITDEPLSINFLRYRPGTRLRIPVKFVGMEQNIDIKRGSFLVRVNRFIECVCDGNEVPQEIVVDVKEAKQKDVIRVDQAVLPVGCTPSQRVAKDYVLAIVANK